MSNVITFSRVFPKYHPRAGEPTYFVEKIWESIGLPDKGYSFNSPDEYMNFIRGDSAVIFEKHHTIRKGNRWKVGDKFSPRIWSGKPYQSKQIIIAPDIEIKKVWDIEIINQKIIINGVYFGEYAKGFYDDNVTTLANNDGLSLIDFENWFGDKFFQGQIICWNDNIKY